MSQIAQEFPMAEKLRALALDVTSEKGEFALFALLLRQDAPGKWDLVVSAPWLEVNKRDGVAYLAEQVQSRLSPDELLSLSRIVVLEKDNPGVLKIRRALRVRGGLAQAQNSVVSGLRIAQAYIIVSQDPAQPQLNACDPAFSSSM